MLAYRLIDSHETAPGIKQIKVGATGYRLRVERQEPKQGTCQQQTSNNTPTSDDSTQVFRDFDKNYSQFAK
ncbi:hypothetical protein GCM10027295_16300 [Pseudaeromonas pectinilytica]